MRYPSRRFSVSPSMLPKCSEVPHPPGSRHPPSTRPLSLAPSYAFCRFFLRSSPSVSLSLYLSLSLSLSTPHSSAALHPPLPPSFSFSSFPLPFPLSPRKWRPHSPSYPFTFIRPRGTHRSSCRVHAWMNASPRPRPHVGGWRGCLPLLARCFYISSFLPSSPSTNIIVTPFGVLESNASSTS